MKTEIHFVLNRRFTCKQTFLNRLKQEILFIAPAVPQGVSFTTGQLSGEDFWGPLSKWEKTLAGACMDYLGEHNRVPFELAPRTGRNPYPVQYRIKGSYNQH